MPPLWMTRRVFTPENHRDRISGQNLAGHNQTDAAAVRKDVAIADRRLCNETKVHEVAEAPDLRMSSRIRTATAMRCRYVHWEVHGLERQRLPKPVRPVPD